MGGDTGVPGFTSRGNVLSSSDVPTLSEYLSLEPLSLGNQKFMRSGELRRALGLPLVSASEDHMFRGSIFKPSTPIATEDLKHFKVNVINASIDASERTKFFRSSITRLDKYIQTIGSKKRQTPDPFSTEKLGGSIILKTGGQLSRNLPDQSVQRMEDRTKGTGINKRFRSNTAELKVDSKLGSLSKDQISNARDTSITKPVCGASAQPEERTLRLSAVGEGWDKNMKRKRSFGTLASRSTDNDMKRPMQSKLNTKTKLTACDTSAARLGIRSNAKQETSTGSPSRIAKGKISRAPRTGSLMAVNFSDGQPSSESCEGWEQTSSTSKVISLGLMENDNRNGNSADMLGQWVVQKQQKSARSRRSNVVCPVTNHEGQDLSLDSVPPIIVTRSPFNGDPGSFDNADMRHIISTPSTNTKIENIPSPGRSSEVEEILGFEHEAKEKRKDNSVVAFKGKDNSDVAFKGKGKVGSFIIPSKRNKNLLNENGIDGMKKQGRTVRGLSLSGVPQSEVKVENMSAIKRNHNTKHGSEKIRGKSGRPPSKKMSDGRVTRCLESNDDHDELLAAASSARKARGLSCSSRFWKKVEPVFGSVSSEDINHLKHQISFAEELEDSQSLVSSAENNLLVPPVQKRSDGPFGRKGGDSNQAVDKSELVRGGLYREKNLDKFSSLYQRVLCALIEEDENEGFNNGYEGASVSFQCASDDSHCGSCNYADTETRDRERFESEAESIVDFQIPKRYPGDRFSCNRSVASNTTRNTSMSDSLYSSGRWLGDDGLSYSDAEFIGGSYQNDIGGPHGTTASGACFDDRQYELMGVDDKLMMELQSIGLYPDAMPDLAEGEVIDQDITELQEGLYDQIGKKKAKLVKIDSVVHDDNQRDKRFVEQLAMEQLVQMAYKRRMAYRRNNATKTIIRRVSKQVATGFIERTLARYTAFEATGKSFFSEPAFQNALFAPPQSVDVGTNIVSNANIANRSPRHLRTPKADSVSLSIQDSGIDDFSGGYINSAQATYLSLDNCFPKLESASHKLKNSESPLDEVPGFMNEGKSRTETKQKVSDTRVLSSSIQQQLPGIIKGKEISVPSSHNDSKDTSENFEEPVDFDNATAPADLNDWFKDLPDGDFTGCLDIPMDDLSLVF